MTTFYNTMRAEWIKMWSTRSALLSTIAIAVLGIGSAVLTALLYRAVAEDALGVVGDTISYLPQSVFSGVTGIGMLVVLIFSVTMVTTEYSTSTIESTFRATPRRPLVFCVKLVVGGLYMALVGLLVTFVSALAAKFIIGGAATVELFSADWANYYWRVPVAFFLVAILSMGVSMIVRSTAGAIALLVVWMTAIEAILVMLSFRVNFAPYLPFQNIKYFLDDMVSLQVFEFKWNSLGAGGYFFGLAALVFLIGLVVADPQLRKFQRAPQPSAPAAPVTIAGASGAPGAAAGAMADAVPHPAGSAPGFGAAPGATAPTILPGDSQPAHKPPRP